MNRMEEVAKLLGVELGETFKIYNYYGNYELTLDGLMNVSGGYLSSILGELLTGRYKISKIHYKPKLNDIYYCVTSENNILKTSWRNGVIDYCLYNVNNCFRTEEEITEADKQRIIKEMMGKYKND